jgi:DnaJ-class molecular chaperone
VQIMSNLYGVLGVSSRADAAAVKTAYRRLAKASHPDLNAGDARAEERFKEISLAYETLGDPEARATYDAERVAERRHAWREVRSVATTMSASFVLTVSWGYVAAKWWLGV